MGTLHQKNLNKEYILCRRSDDQQVFLLSLEKESGQKFSFCESSLGLSLLEQDVKNALQNFFFPMDSGENQCSLTQTSHNETDISLQLVINKDDEEKIHIFDLLIVEQNGQKNFVKEGYQSAPKPKSLANTTFLSLNPGNIEFKGVSVKPEVYFSVFGGIAVIAMLVKLLRKSAKENPQLSFADSDTFRNLLNQKLLHTLFSSTQGWRNRNFRPNGKTISDWDNQKQTRILEEQKHFVENCLSGKNFETEVSKSSGLPLKEAVSSQNKVVDLLHSALADTTKGSRPFSFLPTFDTTTNTTALASQLLTENKLSWHVFSCDFSKGLSPILACCYYENIGNYFRKETYSPKQLLFLVHWDSYVNNKIQVMKTIIQNIITAHTLENTQGLFTRAGRAYVRDSVSAELKRYFQLEVFDGWRHHDPSEQKALLGATHRQVMEAFPV